MTQTHNFDQAAITAALETAKLQHEYNSQIIGDAEDHPLVTGSFGIQAQCIPVTVQNGCVAFGRPEGVPVELPTMMVGSSIPDGTPGTACLDLCTFFGIPSGVKITVMLNAPFGNVQMRQTAGKC